MGAAPLAAGISLGQVVYACGVVENAAGWPVEGIEVRAFGTGPFGRADNLNHIVVENDLTGVTNASGVVTLRLRDESYVVTASDPLTPADPKRAGAAYVPTPNSQGSGSPLVVGLCEVGGVKVDGIPLGAGGRLSIAAPGQAFLVAKVTDGVLAANAALAGADVSLTPTVRESAEDSFHAHTDANGEARLACVSGASGTTVPVRAHLEGYVDTLAQVPCKLAKPAPVVDLTLWRTPITLVATVTNQTDATDVTPAAQVEPKAGVEVPLEAASIALAAQPSAFKPLAPLCAGDAVDPSAVLVTGGESPYRCAAATDAAGVASLRVPWGGAYTLAVSHPLYQSQTRALDLAQADGKLPSPTLSPEDPQDPALSGVNVRSLRFTLVPPEFPVKGKVTDVHGANLSGVAVSFWNNVTAVETTTDAKGNFSTPVVAGPYFLNLTKSGYNPRQCFLDVDRAGNLANVTPAHCFSLITAGKTVVSGVVKDKIKDLAIDGLEVCVRELVACDTTRDGGRYHLELPPATAVVVNTSASAMWEFHATTGYTGPLSLTTGAVDALVDRGTATLSRVHAQTFFYARNATSGLGTVDVTVVQADVKLTPVATGTNPHTNITAANGTYILNLRWSKHPSLTVFDTDPYVVTMTRHRAADHHSMASQAFYVLGGNLTQNQTVTLLPEGSSPTVILVRDAHNGALVTGAAVAAKDPAGATNRMVCDARCAGTSPTATIQLPGEHQNWVVCATLANYEASNGCVTGVAPGSARTILLNRTPVSVAVKAIDPHTGLSIQNLVVRAVPQGAFVCQTVDSVNCDDGAKKTNNQGAMTLSLPWTTDGEMCLTSTAANADVVLQPVGAVQAVSETGVAFQTGRNCAAIPAGASSHAAQVRPLRANATPWTGTLRAADGSPIPGARVVPAIERADFVCAPATHHSGDGVSTDCGGALASDGNYTLRLPTGTLPTHRWTATGNATGFFNETWTTAANGGAMSFRLWPTSFQARLTVKGAEPQDCNADREVGVYLYDLERLRPTGMTSEPASSTPAVPIDAKPALVDGEGNCVATLTVADWNRNPQAQPLGAPAWSKEDNAYAYEVVYQNHVGYGALRLGPLARDATVELTRVSTNTVDYAAGVIRGSVTDADAAVLTGLPAALVTATRAEGPCHGTAGETFTAGTNPAGEYSLAVPCPGTYEVSVAHASDLYTAAAPKVAIIAGDPLALVGGPEALPSATVDFALGRTLVSLKVTVQEIDREQRVQGASVDPAGIDADADPAARLTDAQGVATFAALPWGVYTVLVTAPTSHDTLTPAFVVALVPGGPSELSAVAFKR